ncbi:MAG: HAMP domain-containing histidine kinase [Granulosicoccus sp.]|nr:HAMP domain-containing histidine kinase [Granulosicoccus sp.]
MKIVTQLRLTLLMILVLGLTGATLATWNLNQSRANMARIDISRSIYEHYLTLESHTYQLFKQYGDAIIIGDVNQRSAKRILISLIEKDIKTIRELIADEMNLAGEETSPKIAALTVIEATVKRLVTRLDQFSPTGTGELASDWERLSLVLNDEIDNGFYALIQAALQEEKSNVQAMNDLVDSAMAKQQVFALLFSLATILIGVMVVNMLNQRLTRPIDSLMTGVQKFGEGQLDYRLNLSGRDELSEIGHTFDVMADRVAEKNQTLSSEKESLTKAVEDRTLRLSLMLDEVKRSDESRKRMIADVSHELRTPMTIIKGEADIALRGKDKATGIYKDALRRIREAANHTARLVDDLLFVARSEAGEIQLKLSHIDLQQVVSDATHTFGRDVPVVTDLKCAIVQGDAGRIRQALLVLLENARHHGGDRIELKLEAALNGFRIAVEDAGPGMTEQEKSQAFERFYRGSNAAERYRDGAGLGLPVALSIAQAHGGTITLNDRVGGGLVAALHLPEELDTAFT